MHNVVTVVDAQDRSFLTINDHSCYEVTLSDGRMAMAIVAPDSGIALTDKKYRGVPVRVCFDARGWITHAAVA